MTLVTYALTPSQHGFGSKARLQDLDQAKGLAIIFVVLGHIVAREVPPGAEWYSVLKDTIYLFHMGFFMYLSGFAVGYSYQTLSSADAYIGYLQKKIARLMPAYLIMGVIIFFGKYFAQRFIVVDNPVAGLWGIGTLLYDPTHSYASFLWYLYTLLLLCAIFPIIFQFAKGRIEFFFPIAFAASFLHYPSLFAISSVMTYLPFFLLGAIVSRNKGIVPLFERQWKILLILFISVLVFSFEYMVPKALVGIASIPALHGAMRATTGVMAAMLRYLGELSFSIYLLNTIAIGVTKGLLVTLGLWSGPNLVFLAPVLLTCGLLGPAFIKQFLFRRINFLDRIT